MTFYLFLKQSGEGCDYTIGCGRNLYPLKAATKPEAVEEAKQRILSHMGEDIFRSESGRYAPDAMLIEGEATDLMPLVEELRKLKASEKEEYTKQKKREEIARRELGET